MSIIVNKVHVEGVSYNVRGDAAKSGENKFE
jgi:hypothetical protein